MRFWLQSLGLQQYLCVLYLFDLMKDPAPSQSLETQTKEGQTCFALQIDLVEFKLRKQRGVSNTIYGIISLLFLATLWSAMQIN